MSTFGIFGKLANAHVNISNKLAELGPLLGERHLQILKAEHSK